MLVQLGHPRLPGHRGVGLRPFRQSSRQLLLRLSATGAVALLAGAVLATTAQAASVCTQPIGHIRNGSPFFCATFQYQNFDDNKDNTFNQLLGINASGVIAGYFGSGADAQHPNQGYTLHMPYGNQSSFQDNNFPGSAQTQDIGINDAGTTVGFYVDNAGVQHGWFKPKNGQFQTVDDNASDANTPPMNNLLGINNSGIAVGFYQDNAMNDHGYWYDTNSGQFHPIKVPSGTTTDQAAGINNHRDIAGFATINGNQVGFLIANGQFQQIAFPGADATMATGVNDSDEVVGTYTMGTGDNAHTYGFTWSRGPNSSSAPRHNPVFQSIDAANNPVNSGNNLPNAMPGTTVVNGVDFCGNLVGFYQTQDTFTHGLLANIVKQGTAADTSAVVAKHHKKKKKKKKLPHC